MSLHQPEIIVPDWPTPTGVHAAITGRRGGYSRPPYDGFNLASHVGDEIAAVERNRQLLRESLSLPGQPCWLNQVHGIDVVDATDSGDVPDADGSYSREKEKICLVLTADCLPILLCNREGSEVAALHAGWRSLANGIVATGVARFASSHLLAYLGPAIGASSFEVGSDVYAAFQANSGVWGSSAEIAACFFPTTQNHWHADLYGLAKLALRAVGVEQVFGGDFCTYTEQARFYSFRRDGDTGRMASLIWMADD